MRYGAGVLPICPRTGRALVLLRSRSVTYPLTWAAAGGGEEPSDKGQPIATAVREFAEEAGVYPSEHIAPIASLLGSEGTFHLFASLEPFEFEPLLNFENEAYAWVDFDELMELPEKHPGFADMLENESMQLALFELMIPI